MRYPAAAIVIFLSTFLQAHGQDTIKTDTHKGELSLKIKLLGFVRNNEYFNPIEDSKLLITSGMPAPGDKSLWIEGYTLTGSFIRPELVFAPSERITIAAGAHLLKYSGFNKFSQARPVISASLKLTRSTTLTVGSFGDNHNMFDPHFSRERIYTAYAEDGLQIRTINKHFFNDAWLNWENFIFRGDTTREIFTFGESFRYTSSKFADFLQVEIPAQLQFKHFGGQISDYYEHVTTFFNFTAGVRINADIGQKYGRAGVEYLRFLNSVIPSRSSDIISHGYAGWLRFHYDNRIFHLGVSYWRAHDFYAPNGNGIYASVFDFSSGYVIHDRRVLTGSFFIRYLPEDYFELLFGIETFYDTCANRLDHAMMLHLNFNRIFSLATLR
jgi:hypothetical protein